jgi:hypothetical protein
VEYQEAKKLYEALARSNRKFEEGATKFREIFVKVGSLEKEKQNHQEELAELRPNVQEVNGMMSFSAIVGLSTDFSDRHEIPTSNWRTASKTSMLILLNKGTFGGARRRTNRIKKMNSLSLEGNM